MQITNILSANITGPMSPAVKSGSGCHTTHRRCIIPQRWFLPARLDSLTNHTQINMSECLTNLCGFTHLFTNIYYYWIKLHPFKRHLLIALTSHFFNQSPVNLSSSDAIQQIDKMCQTSNLLTPEFKSL